MTTFLLHKKIKCHQNFTSHSQPISQSCHYTEEGTDIELHWTPTNHTNPDLYLLHLNVFLNAHKKVKQKRANLFAGPAVPQEPPALPRDGGWDGDRAEMLPLCAAGQDTCLAHIWLENHSFPPARGDWSCDMEIQGSSAAIWARSTPAAAPEWKAQAVLFKHCPVLRQLFGYHAPGQREMIFTLYPVISGCLRSKAPLSCSVLLSCCSLTPHTSSSCGTAVSWHWLMTCTKPL